jgi:DNA-binding transcriptional MerR regulator
MGGAPFEQAQRIINDLMHSAMQREEDDGMVDDAEEGEPDPDEREFRKWRMKELGRRLMDEKGFTLDQVKSLLRHPDFPQNALGESRSEQITEDAEVVLKDLVGMGGGPLTEARDRRKMAKDAAHRRRFNRMFPDAQRLEPRPGDFANYGDQPEPTLAMDEQSDGADGRFAEWYPMLANLRVE